MKKLIIVFFLFINLMISLFSDSSTITIHDKKYKKIPGKGQWQHIPGYGDFLVACNCPSDNPDCNCYVQIK